MRIKNSAYYMTVDSKGLKFVMVDFPNSREYRLQELNEINLRFVMAIPIRHQETDIATVVAIFEQRM